MDLPSIAFLLHLFLAKFCPPKRKHPRLARKNNCHQKTETSSLKNSHYMFFSQFQSAIPSPRFFLFDRRPKLQSSATQHESPLPHLPTKNIPAVWETDFFYGENQLKSRWKKLHEMWILKKPWWKTQKVCLTQTVHGISSEFSGNKSDLGIESTHLETWKMTAHLTHLVNWKRILPKVKPKRCR